MKYLLKFKELTNLFFIIPLILTLSYGLYFYGLILFAVIVNSFLFHYYNEKRFIYSDMFFAYSLMICNLFYAWKGGFNYPYFLLAILFAIIALYLESRKIKTKKEYNFNHGDWHIISSIITTLCIFSFVL